MATEHTLSARLKTRYDTLENWSRTDVEGQYANLVLLKGEIAVCYIPSSAVSLSDSTTVTTQPTTLEKVGDGTSTFAALPWSSALAADVYDWAKTSTKPTYTIDEVDPIPTVTLTISEYLFLFICYFGITYVTEGVTYTGTLKTEAGEYYRVIELAIWLDNSSFGSFYAVHLGNGAYLLSLGDGVDYKTGANVVIGFSSSTGTATLTNISALYDYATKGISIEASSTSGTVQKVVSFGNNNSYLDTALDLGYTLGYTYDFSAANSLTLPTSVNLKTVNGETLVGTGDIEISSGTTVVANDSTATPETLLENLTVAGASYSLNYLSLEAGSLQTIQTNIAAPSLTITGSDGLGQVALNTAYSKFNLNNASAYIYFPTALADRTYPHIQTADGYFNLYGEDEPAVGTQSVPLTLATREYVASNYVPSSTASTTYLTVSGSPQDVSSYKGFTGGHFATLGITNELDFSRANAFIDYSTFSASVRTYPMVRTAEYYFNLPSADESTGTTSSTPLTIATREWATSNFEAALTYATNAEIDALFA